MIKESTRSFAALIPVFCLVGCAAESLDDDYLQSEDAVTAAPLTLLTAVAESTYSDQDFANRSTFTNDVQLTARIQLPTAGAAGKHVFVRYQASDTKGRVLRGWSSADAKWVAGNTWELETPAIRRTCSVKCEDAQFDFALALDANGKTLWNNNGRKNFHVESGASPIALFGAQHVLRAGDQYSEAARKVLVWAMHDNARAKITIHYSTDGWRTARDVDAKPNVREQSGNVVVDLAYLPVGPGQTVDYAVRYEVDGAVSWDNNIGRNYRITTK